MLAVGEVLARLQQLRRAQQAADVVGAERRGRHELDMARHRTRLRRSLLAHVTFEFAPLQLAPALVVGVMYGCGRDAARSRRAGATWRQWCFYGGLALMAATLVSPLAHIAEELFLAHMLEHLLLADLGALLIVLGLTGPLLQPLLQRRCRLAARLRATRSSRSSPGRRTSTSGTCPRSTRAR